MANGHGGPRVGSGPKPRKALRFAPAVLSGGKPDEGISSLPPQDLPEDQRAFWQSYAGLAVEKGTLTVNTVPAFRLLCELDAEKRTTKATMDRDGRTFIKVTVDGSGQEHQELKAHPLTGSFGRLAKSVETLMARFGLAPFGKPEPGAIKRKAAVNPFTAVSGK